MSSPVIPKWAPEWEQFEAEVGGVPFFKAPFSDMLSESAKFGDALVRTYLSDPPSTTTTTTTTSAAPTATSTDISIPSPRPSGHSIPLRIYHPPPSQSPTTTTAPLPTILFLHSGGWALGDLDGDDADARDISTRSGATVVSVGYRLAPKHVYPAGLDDCVDTAAWILAGGGPGGGLGPGHDSPADNILGQTDGRILLTGISAGGGLALSVALRLHDLPPAPSSTPPTAAPPPPTLFSRIAGIIAQIPVTIDPSQMPDSLISSHGPYDSYTKHSHLTINTASGMAEFFSLYDAPVGDKYTNILLHPEGIANFPPTFITVAEYDTLTDDGLVLYRMLKDAGVRTEIDVRKGYPHYYWPYPAPCLKGPAEDYRATIGKAVEWVLKE